MSDFASQAENFLKNETEFHLGFLPTEQSNPLTKNMDKLFADSTIAGLRCLQKADASVLPMARKVLASEKYRSMVISAAECLAGGGNIVFSGCGATGRLSILLETMWREFFLDFHDKKYADRVKSIMTGGDFALTRSVESFEDFQIFGRRQVSDLNMNSKDMLVAITEGGETSSVIGTVKECVERGAKVFLLFNNPAEILRERLIRCREVIDDPGVTVLDLSCGPMGLAGSTRMQATTSEQLIAGAMLEDLLNILYPEDFPVKHDFAAGFEAVLEHLASDEMLEVLAEQLEFEVETYNANGRITYYAVDYLLDIFTDTTERSPTFMLPPFCRKSDKNSVESWAFAKDPVRNSTDAWQNLLKRDMRCINWTGDDYRQMSAPQKLIDNPPVINASALAEMEIGNEINPQRTRQPYDRAVEIKIAGSANNRELDEAFAAAAAFYPAKKILEIRTAWQDSPLHLLNHMCIKLCMNNISTGTMVKMGRVAGNWMSHVAISNKKLVDRAVRLLSELGGISYEKACYELFKASEELDKCDWNGSYKPPAVPYVLDKLRKKN